MVEVPDVKGRTAANAATELQAKGLQVSGTQGSPANPVTGTNPAAGTSVRRGTAVAIITS
jgi:beta-lactam-binding protein with PASTA domain